MFLITAPIAREIMIIIIIVVLFFGGGGGNDYQTLLQHMGENCQHPQLIGPFFL